MVDIPAVVEPHLGTSYNPPVSAHQELLLQAHTAEEKRILEAEKNAEVKNRMQQARHVEGSDDLVGAPGMQLDIPTEDAEEEGGVEETSHAKSMPERKTKQQKRKAAKALAEVCGHLLVLLILVLMFFPEAYACYPTSEQANARIYQSRQVPSQGPSPDC